MTCMRCGKNTKGSDVFCAECLAEMERYPVKPGTVIHIPTRQPAEPHRQPRRKKEPPIDVQLATMRQVIRAMTATIIGLATALTLAGGMLVYIMTQPQEAPPTPVSRNYTSAPTDSD